VTPPSSTWPEPHQRHRVFIVCANHGDPANPVSLRFRPPVLPLLCPHLHTNPSPTQNPPPAGCTATSRRLHGGRTSHGRLCLCEMRCEAVTSSWEQGTHGGSMSDCQFVRCDAMRCEAAASSWEQGTHEPHNRPIRCQPYCNHQIAKAILHTRRT
jgi:hypothetical protein